MNILNPSYVLPSIIDYRVNYNINQMSLFFPINHVFLPSQHTIMGLTKNKEAYMIEFKFRKCINPDPLFDDAKKWLSMCKELRPNSGMLFFIEPGLEIKGMPSDARVEYLYMPTYALAAYLINCKMYLRDYFTEKKDLEEGFKGVLLASTGRGMTGHGYDGYDGLVDAMEIFLTAPLKEFLELYGKDYPKFTKCAKSAIKALYGIASGELHSPWGKSEELVKRAKNLIGIWENA